MANVGPTVWYARSGAWTAVTAWAALTAVVAGVLRRQLATPAVGAERVFVCVIAGTTLAAEPAWTTTKGAKTAEAAGPTWQEVTAQPAVNGNTADTTTWTQQKNTTVSIGHIIKNDAGTFLFICDTAGTTGAGSEPAFDTTVGNTTADNTVTWRCIQAATSYAAWAAPFQRVQSLQGTGWMLAGDTAFVGSDHAETQAATMTITFPGTVAAPGKIYSILHSGAITLTTATVTPGASITTTGAFGLLVNGLGYVLEGFTLSAGSGATNVQLQIARTNLSWARLKDCTLIKAGTTGINGAIVAGSANIALELVDVLISFGGAVDTLNHQGILIWRDTPALRNGGVVPTNFFVLGTGGSMGRFSGLDLSGFTSGSAIFLSMTSGISAYYVLENCKLPANAIISTNPTGGPQQVIDYVNCDNGATNYTFGRFSYMGSLVQETAVVRTGGAQTPDLVKFSCKISTSAFAQRVLPFTYPIATKWNRQAGANLNVSVRGIANTAAMPTNAEVYASIKYSVDAASALFDVENTAPATDLVAGTSLAADTSAWDSLVTARVNSETVAAGAIRKLATNAGRVFFCTAITTGILDSSEPAGYATAVDGGLVTDGGATFRAGWRFIITVPLNTPAPQQTGPIYTHIHSALVSSTIYVDAKIS